MIMPSGKMTIRNAGDTYSSLLILSERLEKEGLTGYLCARYGAQKDFILYKKGTIVASLETIGSSFHATSSSKIIERAQKCNEVSVAELREDICSMVEIILSRNVLYEDLRSDFTKFRPFLLVLSEDKASCVIEVACARHYGCILLDGGMPVNAYFFDGYLYWEEEEALRWMLADMDKEIHTINVYEKKD